MIGTVK